MGFAFLLTQPNEPSGGPGRIQCEGEGTSTPGILDYLAAEGLLEGPLNITSRALGVA